MSVKNNLDYIKNEFSNDEKMLENAFRLEILYKRYKRVIWGLAAVLVALFAGGAILSFYKEKNAQKFSAIYDAALENSNDENLKKLAENENLYDLYSLRQALNNGNVSELERLSKSKNELVAMIANYHFGSFEREAASLAAANLSDLGDLANLQIAYEALKNDKPDAAKEALSKIAKDSQFAQFATLLSHYAAGKDSRPADSQGSKDSPDSRGLDSAKPQDSKDSQAPDSQKEASQSK